MRSRKNDGCAVDGCDGSHHCHGWCVTHYQRWRAHGDPLTILTDRGRPLIERFTNRYQIASNGCWLWTKGTNDAGYSRFAISHTENVAGHRWAYEHFIGPIPDGWTVDHACHNADPTCSGGPTCQHRLCVNPIHLEAKTLRDNLLSGNTLSAKNAAKTHCPRNHPYDAVDSNGARICRTCRNADAKRSRANRARRLAP